MPCPREVLGGTPSSTHTPIPTPLGLSFKTLAFPLPCQRMSHPALHDPPTPETKAAVMGAGLAHLQARVYASPAPAIFTKENEGSQKETDTQDQVRALHMPPCFHSLDNLDRNWVPPPRPVSQQIQAEANHPKQRHQNY